MPNVTISEDVQKERERLTALFGHDALKFGFSLARIYAEHVLQNGSFMTISKRTRDADYTVTHQKRGVLSDQTEEDDP